MQRSLFIGCFVGLAWQLVRASDPGGFTIEWGYNSAMSAPADPHLVSTGAVAISAGSFHGLSLSSDGTVAGWGDNFSGRALGDPAYKSGATNGVVRINGSILSNVLSIAADREFSLALRRDGTIVTWGENYVPVGMSNIVGIAAEWGHSWALKSDGSVAGWASRPFGHSHGSPLGVSTLSNV